MAKNRQRAPVSHNDNRFLFSLRIFLSQRKKLKGQSILLTHAILVGFTIFLVYAVTMTFVGIRDDYQKFVGANEVNQLCFVLKSAVDKIYVNTDYNFTTTTLAGYVDINMPSRITDLPYRASFVNRSVFLQSIDRKFNDSCLIGIDATYDGATTGGLTRFSYTIMANGTRAIGMVKI